MDESKNRNRSILLIRWIARISSIVIVAFLLLMLVGEALSPTQQSSSTTSRETFGLLFFPIGLCLGLILAWKWEKAGGIIAIASMVAFHLTIKDAPLWMLGFAVPGLLFIACWISSRGQESRLDNGSA
jgi:membrane protease YdiL (CAAX protease family)